MPSTYEPIATVTASGSSASQLVMSSIPSTYTDLIIVSNCRNSGNNLSLYIRFNNDSGSNYSTTYLYGNGSSAASGRITNRDSASIGYYVTPSTGFDFVAITQIQNYANTNTYKSLLTRSNSTGSGYPGAEASVSLWRSTAAINQIDIRISAGTIDSGSTFTLYGIKAA
jgi:hypothetical protein